MNLERNRACRIAYRHARNGRAHLAELWLGIAAQFAEPTEKQRAHVERLLRKACTAIPGQLDIEGREAA